MAYSFPDWGLDMDLKISVKTAPFNDVNDELITQMAAFIHEHVEIAAEVNRTKPQHFLETGWTGDNTTTLLNEWTRLLVREYGIPMTVRAITRNPSYGRFEEEFLFGIELTQAAVDTWRKKQSSELTDLLGEVFGGG